MPTLIDQREIPGLSRLFADYLYDGGKVRAFYPTVRPFDIAALAASAGRIEYEPNQRRAMSLMLAHRNRGWGASAATTALIDRFSQPGTVAVVTGQQVGLFGGPLLALHKAMTAVLIAERLRTAGVEAVPIFWMASQDHDLAEVSHTWALNEDGVPVKVSAPIAATANEAVGRLRLGSEMQAALDEMAEATGGAQSKALAELRETYASGATLAGAFAALFSRWFADMGLIVFDPLEAGEASVFLSPCYRRVFDRSAEIAAALERRARALEAAGYHVQVEMAKGASLIFLHRGAERLGLRRHGEKWMLGDQPISEAEVQQWLRDRPADVSASALLRPVVQDIYFPTVAQVTGPAETAYLAQSSALYEALQVRQPVPYPRASVTLLDARAERLLQKHGLTVPTVWRSPVEEELARRALPPELSQTASRLRAAIERDFTSLADQLRRLDPTLVDAAETAGHKIRHQLEQLEGRVARSLSRRNEELRRQAQHLAGSIYPGGHLQERVLGAAGWMARNGDDLCARLHQELSVETPDHQVVAN